jgi:hypothetical protein
MFILATEMPGVFFKLALKPNLVKFGSKFCSPAVGKLKLTGLILNQAGEFSGMSREIPGRKGSLLSSLINGHPS